MPDTGTPVYLGFTPPNGAPQFNQYFFVLQFDRPVHASNAASMTITGSDGSSLVIDGRLTAVGNGLRVYDVRYVAGVTYHFTLAPGSVVDDVTGATLAGPISGDFAAPTTGTDTAPPVLLAREPDGVQLVYQSTVQLQFNEQVKLGNGGSIHIYSSDGRLFQDIPVTTNFINDGLVSISTKTFDYGQSYYVTMDPGAILDIAGNPYAGISSPNEFRFTAAPDTTAPGLLDVSPYYTELALLDTDIVLHFGEAVQAGTGSVIIGNAHGFNATIAMSDTSQVSVSGKNVTIHLASPLPYWEDTYTIRATAGAVTDLAGNASISSNTFLIHTMHDPYERIAPRFVGVTPGSGILPVVGWPVTLLFSEGVQAGSGTIRVYRSDGTLVRTYTPSNVAYGTGAGQGQGSIQLTNLQVTASSSYYILMDEGFAVDLAGNKAAAITSPVAVRVTTPSQGQQTSPTGPTLDDETTFISAVKPDGSQALTSYRAWNEGTRPADYSGGYTNALKWGAPTAGTAGGTVYYTFDSPASLAPWSPAQKQALAGGLALWSAIANINFVETSDPAQAQLNFLRGDDLQAKTSYRVTGASEDAGKTGSSVLLQLTGVDISIDTAGPGFAPLQADFSALASYALMTLLHEEGHALGLGHAGPYNFTINRLDQQFSAYDTRAYTLMSYLDTADTSKFFDIVQTNWGSYSPSTPMIDDILAAQRLYGTPVNSPLSGGQVFGFNSNITGAAAPFYDFNLNSHPVVTLWDGGLGNVLDLSGFAVSSAVSLVDGTFNSVNGMGNNLAIAIGTRIDTVIGGAADDAFQANAFGDSLHGGGGNDTLYGGAGADFLYGDDGNDGLLGGGNIDTAVFAGAYGAYTIVQDTPGFFTITSPGGVDSLTGVEYAKFDDRTVRLLPGSGTTLTPGLAPSSYMAAIRDFDGNNLTGQGTQVIDPNNGRLTGGSAWDGVSGWSVAGSADVSGSGSTAQILFNSLIGRWAEVTTQADGQVYFGNSGWAGDTRIVGIYNDPEVTTGHAVKNGPDDSQRRFQNDLFIGNIKSVLGAGDYNHDGFQEVYFSLNDGTAYLHALMWNDGNVQYANYQSEQQVRDYLTANSVAAATWSSWLPPHEAPIELVAANTVLPAMPGLGGAGNILAASV